MTEEKFPTSKPAFKPKRLARHLNAENAIDIDEIELPRVDTIPADSSVPAEAGEYSFDAEQVAQAEIGETGSGKKAVVSMAVGTLISRALGFVKLGLTLWVLGSATDISDSFAFANQAPNVLYILIGGGALNSILVPQIIKASKVKDGGVLYIQKLVTLVTLVSAGVTLLLVVLSPLIIDLFGNEWSKDRSRLTLIFLLWCLPQIFFYVIYTIFGQILNARSVFQPYMWAPILNNIVAIAGLLAFAHIFGIVGNDPNAIHDWNNNKTLLLLGTTTLGIVVQALILIRPILKLGYSLKPSWGWRGMGFRETANVAVWAIALVLINQLSYLVIFWVAVQAGGMREHYAGNPSEIAGNATYDAASMLITFPHGIIAVSIATLMFTRMSKAADQGDMKSLITSMSYAQRVIALLTFFACAIFVVLNGQIGMAVGGENAVAGQTMGFVILSLCANIPLLSMNYVFQRVFYSLNDSKTPFLIQIPVTALVAVLALAALLLPVRWIVIGLGLNGAVTLALSIWLDVILIRKRTGDDIDGAHMMNSFMRIAVAAIVSGIAGALVLWPLGGFNLSAWPWKGSFEAIVTAVPVVAVMGIVYFIMLKVLKVEELDELLGSVKAKLPARIAKFL
ncbi:MAG: lipid II flippase MurJ [Micrococcaceae bacterium]